MSQKSAGNGPKRGKRAAAGRSRTRAAAASETRIAAELAALGAPRGRVAAAGASLMLAETRDRPFTDPAWIWEIKYDGFRLLAAREGLAARLRYRSGLDATAAFPDLVRALSGLAFERLVLDAEVVVLDDLGRPRFGLLQKRALLQRRLDIERAAVELPATLFAFDLLALGDFDLRTLPLLRRKSILRRVLPATGPLRFADHVDERGEALYAEAGRMGLEGVVGKRADSPYRGGRSADWVKVRLDRTGDFAVVGFTAPEGARSGFGALHLGHWTKEGLVYAGRVGTGFSAKQLGQIGSALRAAARSTPACAGPVPRGRGHVWVEPELVCEVRYKEWTGEGLLRQPVFVRLRDDKPISECVR